MNCGTLYLRYVLNGTTYEISLGTVDNLQDTIQKKVSVTPVVSIGMENAFPVDAGNSRSLSLAFTRKSPYRPNDTLAPSPYTNTEQWSNKHWYEQLSAAVDRFQMKTDGFDLIFAPSLDNPYMPAFSEHGYVKNLSRTYMQAIGDVIIGSLTFTIGSAYVSGSAPGVTYPVGQMTAIMSDPSKVWWYPLATGSDSDAISSVRITGGPQSPMEMATIKLSRKKFQAVANALCSDNGMIGYKNEVRLDIMGEHNMILYQAPSYNGDSITITAVTKAIIYNLTTLAMKIEGRPFDIIYDLLQNNTSGYTYDAQHIVFAYLADNNQETMFFPAGDNVYRVLQICAIMLGCNLWFADDKAYIVDFRQPAAMYQSGSAMVRSSGMTMSDAGELNISEMGGKCAGATEIDGEGAVPLANSIIIKCSDTPDVYQENANITVSNTHSIGIFGTVSGGTKSIPELCEHTGTGDTDPNHIQATIFGQNYLSYIGECQRSKTMTLKELYAGSGSGAVWGPTFGEVARATRINDAQNGDIISNRSADGRTVLPQKLILSSWTRQYPEGRTEYTFGIISNIDLSTNTASVSNALNTLRLSNN